MAAEGRVRKHRQVLRGVVVSDKMSKTRVIEVKHTTRHGLYQKNLIKQGRFFIHDEKNESKTGDMVTAVSVRTLSKNKSFRLLKVIEKRVAE